MLTDFRCYGRQVIETDAAPVVLTGANGAGKTNILEAISYLTPGRGLRGAKLPEVARDGAASWAVAGRVDLPGGSVDLGSGWGHDGAEKAGARRNVRINGASARGQAALGDYLSVVWLTPAMDRLMSEGAGVRRRFLDRLVLGLDPEHAGRTAAYDQAYRQRNRLLAEGGGDDRWFSALEDTMARYGVAVTAARTHLVADLNAALAERTDSQFPVAYLSLTGDVARWLEDLPAVDAEDRLRSALAMHRQAAQGSAEAVTAEGPHRSDMTVSFAGTGRPADMCSTGEQKALLLSILLAHARLHARTRGRPPVLLLDEVVAHLDEKRRSALFDEIRALKAQAWLTGTDPALFSDMLDDAQHLHVHQAAVKVADPLTVFSKVTNHE